MVAISQLLVAGYSDVGRQRTENEDRFFIDAQRGIFLVVDGLGGHAAGERAAEIAVDIISSRLSRRTGASDKRIQEAFALASTEIFDAASRHPEWAGMACVATVAVIEEDRVTVGQVGDSRLYLLTPGKIEKITRDHSPVGELEDSQRLSEDAAMRHPRRNEVYRDLGSAVHTPNDTDFVEIHSFALPHPAALLLCSDGLTDQMTAAAIRQVIERHAGVPEDATRALVKAANEAGGKDNVTVVLVETDDYAGVSGQRSSSHSSPWTWFLLGLLAASALFLAARPYWEHSTSGLRLKFGVVRSPQNWTVGPNAIPTIGAALDQARAGDTIQVSPGEYHEDLHLRSGVSVASTTLHGARILSPSVAVLAEDVHNARFAGFDIAGSNSAGLGTVGIRIAGSDLYVTDVRVSGMQNAGIEITGRGESVIRASEIADNPGVGVAVHEDARPRLEHNLIRHNGHGPPTLPGILIEGAAAPILFGNIVEDSGAEQIWASPSFDAGSLLTDNVVAPETGDKRHQLKVTMQ